MRARLLRIGNAKSGRRNFVSLWFLTMLRPLRSKVRVGSGYKRGARATPAAREKFGESIMQINSGGLCQRTRSPAHATPLAIRALAAAAALAAAGAAAPVSAQQQGTSTSSTAPLQEVVV